MHFNFTCVIDGFFMSRLIQNMKQRVLKRFFMENNENTLLLVEMLQVTSKIVLCEPILVRPGTTGEKLEEKNVSASFKHGKKYAITLPPPNRGKKHDQCIPTEQ